MDPRHPRSARLLTVGALGLVLALLTALPAQAQRVEAYLSADSVTVGDRFTLTLVALHGFAADPSFPDPTGSSDSTFGDLEVLGVAASGSRFLDATSSGTRLDSVVYEVTTFALDTANVPPIPVFFSSESDTATVASLPMILPIISLVPEEAEGIRDLAPLVDFSMPIWPYVLLGLALLLAVGLLIYYLRHRKDVPEPEPEPEPVPQTSPYEAALSRIRLLETAPLEITEQVKPFYVELSDLLRTYLEDSLDVPALECTTRELMDAFEQRTVRHKLPGGAPQRVHGILELADLVKFADLKPPTTQSRMALDETRKTVDVIEAKLRQMAMDRERMAPRIQIEPAEPVIHDGTVNQ